MPQHDIKETDMQNIQRNNPTDKEYLSFYVLEYRINELLIV